MPGIIGNIIVIIALIALVSVCLREIIGGLKSGSWAGCGEGCAFCSRGCINTDTCDKAKASKILKKIRKPKRAQG